VFCGDPGTLTPARVIRIVDGDTLHVEQNGRDETVRLYGINATEVGQPCSAEATARLKQLAGQDVLMRPDARDRDRYGRLIRYVYTTGGLSIDAELVDEGLAYAWRSDGDLRFAIIDLEAQARAAHRGCLPS
jgi:micrococcal nuclease